MSFASLGLHDHLLKALEVVSYQDPTRIQTLAIPHVLEGRDLIGVAQTGTGKTAAFALPILQTLSASLPKKTTKTSILCLVITPTRELALQVAEAFRSYAKFAPQKVGVLALIGGEDIEKQLRELRAGMDVIVATPGRLLDLIDRGEIRLSELQTLVLDEADKLLDLGFADELEALFKELPSDRQSLFFSATFPNKVATLSERFLTKPLRVSAEGEEVVVEKITQRVFEVDSDRRRMLMQHLLDEEAWNQVLVFVATKVKARNLAAKLRESGYLATEFHGDLEQDQRNEVMRRFKRQSHKILVATDVAARGLDIDNLSCVINFDLPRSPNDYVHRIGRTGRAGQSGVAISFIDYDTEAQFRLIEKRAGVRLEREQLEGFELTGERPKKVKGAAPVKGKRMSKKDKLRAKAAAKE